MASNLQIEDPGNTGIPWEQLTRLAFEQMGYQTSRRVYISGIEADVIGINDGNRIVCECKDVDVIYPHHVYKVSLLGILLNAQPVLAITRRGDKTVHDLSKGVKELLVVFDVKVLTCGDVHERRSPRKPKFDVSVKDSRKEHGVVEDTAPQVRSLKLMNVHEITRGGVNRTSSE